MGLIGYDLENMVPMPVGEDTPRAIFTSEDGILLCYGKVVPTGAGYATGCIFIHTDGTGGSATYFNEGTATTADFDTASFS